uniref:uncharacterized protein LOC122608866 n=1 Tax=Erigeron canadensis TaxID=72917 RepID=UPI001CB9868B|nr:uncharacterized protein LOC122608866 [Erigeron canadensis]
MTTGSSTPPVAPLHKAYSITTIKSQIPLTLDLNHLNYDIWTDLFETHCIAFDVIDHIDDTYDATTTNPDNKPPTKAEWTKLDYIVQNWIYNTITSDVLANVHARKATARATWLAIETLFRTNKEAKSLQLDNDLRNITLGNMSINDYCTKIKTMADLLKNIGTPVPNNNLVAYTLNRLP